MTRFSRRQGTARSRGTARQRRQRARSAPADVADVADVAAVAAVASIGRNSEANPVYFIKIDLPTEQSLTAPVRKFHREVMGVAPEI